MDKLFRHPFVAMKKSWLPSIIFLIACVAIAVKPLLGPGFLPTHDGEYHLIRFFEFEKMLKSGYWFPRWAPGLNSGYGVPLFNFHYPLPNYIGVFYHSLGFNLADSFKFTLATGYILAVFFCFLWLSKLFRRPVAVAASVVFAFVPYWFVDIYVRGSVGEVLAIVWLMLALAAIERNRHFLYIVSLAGVILSHNILTVLFLPLLVLYSAIRKPGFIWYVLIGMGLSAYFWIPALAERSYVVGLNTVNYQDHFVQISDLLIPSWGTGFSASGGLGNRISLQIGIIPLLLLFLGGTSFLRAKPGKDNDLARFFFIVAAVSLFLTLDYSKIIWSLIPILPFIQYPWRFLSLLLPVTAFLAAYAFSKMKITWLVGGISLLAVVFAYPYSRPVVYAPRSDAYYLTKPNFTDGTSSLGNAFSTRWSAWKRERPGKKIELISGNGEIHLTRGKPLNYEFTIEAKTNSVVRVNTLYYPGWTVTRDRIKQSIDYENDGTITLSVPPGFYHFTAKFTETPLRYAADLVSILSLFWLLRWAILKKYL